MPDIEAISHQCSGGEKFWPLLDWELQGLHFQSILDGVSSHTFVFVFVFQEILNGIPTCMPPKERMSEIHFPRFRDVSSNLERRFNALLDATLPFFIFFDTSPFITFVN